MLKVVKLWGETVKQHCSGYLEGLGTKCTSTTTIQGTLMGIDLVHREVHLRISPQTLEDPRGQNHPPIWRVWTINLCK